MLKYCYKKAISLGFFANITVINVIARKTI